MHSMVLVACPADSAERIADELLKLRLAACVNVVERMHSRYWWKGKIESADESLLLIKTKGELFQKIEHAVKRVHPYEVPEIIEVRVQAGSQPYLDWIGKEVALGRGTHG